MTKGIVEGTKRSGAKLVALDNLYMYGDTARMRETSTVSPRSKKGELRARAAELMLDAGAAIGRAADFFGPHAPLGAVFGERFFKRALVGKRVECFGDPDMLHSYSYTPDVAAGLVSLGLAHRPGVWMLPVQPAETTRAVIARFALVIGRDISITTVPNWMVRALGVFDPMVREFAEMIYQWRQPFVVDDAAIRETFGLEPTPWDQAISTTAAWGERAYGARSTSRAQVA